MRNLKCIKATYKEYIAAIERLNKRGFKHLSRRGSGYTHYLGNDFNCYEGEIEEADACVVSCQDLFDYGRPIHIEKSHSTYKESFVRLYFSATDKYKDTYLDSDFKTNKMVVKTTDSKITIDFKSISIGIANWTPQKKQELTEMANKCKENVRQSILQGIADADHELNKWRESRRKLISEEI